MIKYHTKKNAKKAFTLIEIMIVVLIIGVLLAIATPNFVRSRAASRQKACISNLRAIQSATEQWAIDTKKKNGEYVVQSQLIGPTLYMKTEPKCPSTGLGYYYMYVGQNPLCWKNTAPDAAGINHKLASTDTATS
jgi:prepilin-type N-terminal cleavage/methylation domain-containing protein